MPARVSVIVRTKNRPAFLARALADISRQSFVDAEVIVVNDGGDPALVEHAVAASAVADRARIVVPAAPGGRCAAANAGLREAAAAYVVLHDDDDLWHTDFLTRTVALLDASPDDGGVMTATEIIYEEQRAGVWVETGRAPFWEGMSGVSFTSLLEVNRAVPISFLYRRSLHDEVGWYDESLDAVEDWDFYLRVAARYPLAFLGGTPLAYWTQRPGSTGAEGNSMFELAALHERDDLAVRDRALRAWVTEHGAGLPLYIALIERRLLERIDALEKALVREASAQSPVTWLLRRARRTLRNMLPSRRR